MCSNMQARLHKAGAATCGRIGSGPDHPGHEVEAASDSMMGELCRDSGVPYLTFGLDPLDPRCMAADMIHGRRQVLTVPHCSKILVMMSFDVIERLPVYFHYSADAAWHRGIDRQCLPMYHGN